MTSRSSPSFRSSAIRQRLAHQVRQIFGRAYGDDERNRAIEVLQVCANRFDLRHRRADQLGDYAEAFLDWIFHWYLATIRLTDEIAITASGRSISSS